MHAAEVVARSCAGDKGAWAELCALARRELRPRLEWLLRWTSLDTLCDADDALQLLYCRLFENDYRRLRSFRGKTEPELIRFLRKAARRLILNLLRSSARQQAHFTQYKLAVCRQRPDEDKSFLVSEAHIKARIAELAANMPESDLRKLRALLEATGLASLLPLPTSATAAPGTPDAPCPSSRKPPPLSRDPPPLRARTLPPLPRPCVKPLAGHAGKFSFSLTARGRFWCLYR